MQRQHGSGRASVSSHVLGSSEEPEGETGADVGYYRESDEEGLGEGGLVDLAGEEEVGF